MANLIMKRIANLLLAFGIGFYGVALIVDVNPKVFMTKSIVFFALVFVATILHLAAELTEK